MKYTLITRRTYETTYSVETDSEIDAWNWVNSNADLITEEELRQCNVIDEDTELVPCVPSPNEADELVDLVGHIKNKLQDYRHVGDYVPKKLLDALDEMLLLDGDED